MEINWFTVVAQLINFFLLVWLLKRFLYKPILKAIDERENKIVEQLERAELKKKEAQEEQEKYQQKIQSFDQTTKDRMDKMKTEIAEERDRLMGKARIEAEELSEKLANSAKAKQQEVQLSINKKIQKEVFATSRKLLHDLASVGLEQQLVAVFIQQLKGLNEGDLKQMKIAFKNKSSSFSVRTAAEIPEKGQRDLRREIDSILNSDSDLVFEVVPELIGGIELCTDDYKLAWSISGYLKHFETAIANSSELETDLSPSK